jgi:hypothetical protein
MLCIFVLYRQFLNGQGHGHISEVDPLRLNPLMILFLAFFACGELKTALMQACRFGHWEVVQTLLVFRCNVSAAQCSLATCYSCADVIHTEFALQSANASLV